VTAAKQETFSATCPQCGTTRSARKDFAGRVAVCSCGAKFRLLEDVNWSAVELLVPKVETPKVETQRSSYVRIVIRNAALSVWDWFRALSPNGKLIALSLVFGPINLMVLSGLTSGSRPSDSSHPSSKIDSSASSDPSPSPRQPLNKTIDDDIHYEAYRRDMEREGLNPDMQSEAEVRALNKLLRDKGLY
jgi:hypothetical protein